MFEKILSHYLGTIQTKHLEKLRILVCGAALFTYLNLLKDPTFFLAFSGRFLGFKLPPLVNAPLFYLLLISILCSMAGLFTRLSIFTFLILHLFFDTYGIYPNWGWANYLTAWLILLGFCPPIGQWSADHHLRSKPQIASIEVWPLRLFQLQTSLMYFVIVALRLDSLEWWNGTALQKFLECRHLSRLSFIDFSPHSDALFYLTYLGLALEILGAFLIFSGKYSARLVFFLIPMHLALWGMADLGPWQLLVIFGLLTFLIPVTRPDSSPLRTSKKLMLTFFGILTPVLFAFSLPASAIDEKFMDPYVKIKNALKSTGLGLAYKFHMMKNIPPNIICGYVDEVELGKVGKNIYSTDSRLCDTEAFFFNVDPKLQFIEKSLLGFRYKKRILKLEAESLDILWIHAKEKLGSSFCYGDGYPKQSIVFTVFFVREWRNPENTVTKQFALDCKNHEMLTEFPEGLKDLTKQRMLMLKTGLLTKNQ